MILFGWQKIKELENEISSLKNSLEIKDSYVLEQRQTILDLQKKLKEVEPVLSAFNFYSDLYKPEQPVLQANFESLQNLWAKWPLDIHTNQAQIERQIRATAAIYTPLSLSPGIGTGRFKSVFGEGGTYTTSLIKCECEDFKRRLLPCKHMYRLAHELDVYMLDGVQSVPNPQNLFSLEAAKRQILGMSGSLRDDFYTILEKDGLFVDANSSTCKLLNTGLVKKGTNEEALLSNLNRDVLYSFIPQDTEFKIPKNMKKSNLISLMIEQLPEAVDKINLVYFYLVPVPELEFMKSKLLYFMGSL